MIIKVTDSTIVKDEFVNKIRDITNKYDNDFNINIVLNCFNDYYSICVTNELTFIGEWDALSAGAKSLANLFASSFIKFLPSISMMFSESGLKGISFENYRNYVRNLKDVDKSMIETSPINATLGDIVTPEGKRNNTSDHTGDTEEKFTNAKDIEKYRELYLKQLNVYTIVESCFNKIIDEYTKFW